MERDRIKELIAELDKLVPVEGKVLMAQQGGGADESVFKGTESGYLRFGLEVLKGAFMSPLDAKAPTVIHLSLQDVVSEESDIWFMRYERTEDLIVGSRGKPTVLQNILTNIAIGFFLIILMTGFSTVLGWFF